MAIQDFSKTIESEKSDYEIYYLRGIAYYELKVHKAPLVVPVVG